VAAVAGADPGAAGVGKQSTFFYFLFFIFMTTLKSYDTQRRETETSNPCCFD
jgi:hypothetical protein